MSSSTNWPTCWRKTIRLVSGKKSVQWILAMRNPSAGSRKTANTLPWNNLRVACTIHAMAPRTVSLFEHQPRQYNEIGLEPRVTAARERAFERICAGIERLNELAGQEIIHLGRKELRANQFVGIVR